MSLLSIFREVEFDSNISTSGTGTASGGVRLSGIIEGGLVVTTVTSAGTMGSACKVCWRTWDFSKMAKDLSGNAV
jgi:hypothetical protein